MVRGLERSRSRKEEGWLAALQEQKDISSDDDDDTTDSEDSNYGDNGKSPINKKNTDRKKSPRAKSKQSNSRQRRKSVNGDLDDQGALEAALKASMKESSSSSRAAKKNDSTDEDGVEIIAIHSANSPHADRHAPHLSQSSAKTLDSSSSPSDFAMSPSLDDPATTSTTDHSPFTTGLVRDINANNTKVRHVSLEPSSPRAENHPTWGQQDQVSNPTTSIDNDDTTTNKPLRKRKVRDEFSAKEHYQPRESLASAAVSERDDQPLQINTDAPLVEEECAPAFTITKVNSIKTKSSKKSKADREARVYDVEESSQKKKKKKKMIPAIEDVDTVPSNSAVTANAPSTTQSCPSNDKQGKKKKNRVATKPKKTKLTKTQDMNFPSSEGTLAAPKTDKENSMPCQTPGTTKGTTKATTSEKAAHGDSTSLAANEGRFKATTTTNEQKTVATKKVKSKEISTTNVNKPAKAPSTQTLDKAKSSNNKRDSSNVALATSDQPQKKKKKKLNFQEKVLNHMLVSFKPFTIKQLVADMSSSESSLEYVMLSLIDKGLVVKKDFIKAKSGRSKVLYWAMPGVKAKEVSICTASLQEIVASKQELQELVRSQAVVNKTLKEMNSEMSNDEIDQRLSAEEQTVNQLRQQVIDMKERIRRSKESKPQPKQPTFMRVPPKSEAELARERCPRRMKIRINKMRSDWISRKAQCVEFVDILADGMEKHPKQVAKLLDLETDEMEGVKVPPKHEIENESNNGFPRR